jgi:hypothetical protein
LRAKALGPTKRREANRFPPVVEAAALLAANRAELRSLKGVPQFVPRQVPAAAELRPCSTAAVSSTTTTAGPDKLLIDLAASALSAG